MTEWIWFNGQIVTTQQVKISVEDRGFQFADGVYEVIRLYGGKPFTLNEHLERLGRSAAAIQIELPYTQAELSEQIQYFIGRVQATDAFVYLQVTRGVSPRNHLFPQLMNLQVTPTIFFYARPLLPLADPTASPGLRLLAVPDDRWKKCWIKSLALLPNVLAKSAAVAAGADEAIYIDNGIVTECSASNFFAVINKTLVTHPVGEKVLPGITRQVLLQCAANLGIPVQERPMTEAEATSADELFITSTTRQIGWVNTWNGGNVGLGRCGPIMLALHEALQRRISDEIGMPVPELALAM
jgi:D-alanine transaminase